MRKPTHAVLLALALAAQGCRIEPLAPIPEPLAATAAWTRDGHGGAFLGLKTEENDSRRLDALFFEPGLRVVRVVENSPAARAGMQSGDVLLAVDGTEVAHPEDLDALLARLAAGTTVELHVRRGDGVFAVPVELVGRNGEALSAARLLHHVDRARTRAAWRTAPGGAELVSVAPDSPLVRAGLEPGSVVVALDGEAVASAPALLRQLAARAPGQRVTLQVARPAPGEAVPPPAEAVQVALLEQPTRVTGFAIPILFDLERQADGTGTRVELLDFWLFALFRYERVQEERTWTLLELFEFSTGKGELGS